METLKFYEGGYNPEKEYVLYKSLGDGKSKREYYRVLTTTSSKPTIPTIVTNIQELESAMSKGGVIYVGEETYKWGEKISLGYVFGAKIPTSVTIKLLPVCIINILSPGLILPSTTLIKQTAPLKLS